MNNKPNLYSWFWIEFECKFFEFLPNRWTLGQKVAAAAALILLLCLLAIGLIIFCITLIPFWG